MDAEIKENENQYAGKTMMVNAAEMLASSWF